jgi:preprotein translocase subunit SecE
MEEQKIGIVDRIKNYVKETISESKKVSWPDRKHVWSATMIIIVLVFVIAGSIMVIDFGLSRVLSFLTRAR